MAQPLGMGVRVLAWGVALLTGLTGLTLFGVPELAGGTLWPWRLTPLVSRYLGALFLGVAVGAALVARAREWAQVRLVFPPALVFTGLSLVAAGLHAGSFDPARLATWAWVGLYLGVFVAGLVTYVRYERGRRAGPAPQPPHDDRRRERLPA
jgi:hypothetical protein